MEVWTRWSRRISFFGETKTTLTQVSTHIGSGGTWPYEALGRGAARGLPFGEVDILECFKSLGFGSRKRKPVLPEAFAL